MPEIPSISQRFRELRERAGLSPEDVVYGLTISSNCIWDIEEHDDELSSCYSPYQVNEFARNLGVRAIDLFGDAEGVEPPLSAVELVRLIHEQCRFRQITLEQFERVVEWRLSDIIEPPESLFRNMTVDGLQWLCRELGVDWRRALLSL